MAEALANMHNVGESTENRNANAVPVAASRKSTRGFASMDPAKQREIARKGGRAAHLKGTAHEFTPEEARAAGRKGGEAVSRDRAHMAQIGREGGQARGARAALRHQQEQMARTGEGSHLGGNQGGGIGSDSLGGSRGGMM
jgi:general stress protein YciG